MDSFPAEVVQEFDDQLDAYIESWKEEMLREAGSVREVKEWVDWDEDKHPRDKGKFSSKPGASGSVKTKDGPALSVDPEALARTAKLPEKHLHEEAERIAADVEQKSKGVLAKLGAAGRWLKDKTKQLYNAMEARYGRKTAIAIFAAGHVVGLATPLAILPGSTLIGMAPFAALAETYLLAKKGVQKLAGKEAVEPELSQPQVAELAVKVLQKLHGWAGQLQGS